jgi:hypothetical protein
MISFSQLCYDEDLTCFSALRAQFGFGLEHLHGRTIIQSTKRKLNDFAVGQA